MSRMPRRSPSQVLVHVVWATLGRRPALPEGFDGELAAILGRKASVAGCALLGAGVASDHVHALLLLGSKVALADAVQRLKGAAAHDINRHAALAVPLVWQAGYWAESFGPADLDPLVRYLRRQRTRHDESHPAEGWQHGVD